MNRKKFGSITIILSIIIFFIVTTIVLAFILNKNEPSSFNNYSYEIELSNPGLKVGDYVDYLPDFSTLDTNTLLELEKYSGYKDRKDAINNYDDTYYSDFPIFQENLNWRVLDIQDGKIRLISDTPTNCELFFSGYNGYNNSVYLINIICDILYSNSIYGTAKNLSFDDIKDYLSYDFENIIDDNGIKYNECKVLSSNIHNGNYFPDLYKLEINSYDTNATLKESEQLYPIFQNSPTYKDELKVTNTYFNQRIEPNNFKDFKDNTSKYFDLFIGNENAKYANYFLSSRCVKLYPDFAHFMIYTVTNSNSYIFPELLYSSDNQIGMQICSFRPVVTLNENIKIELCQGENSINNMHSLSNL